MKNVVLDTNALMIPYQFGINVEKELSRLLGICRIIVPKSIVEEMERITERGGSEARAAQLGLSIVKKKNYRVVETEARGDDAVLEAALKMDAVVVTNDKELKNRAAELGLSVVYMRGENKLEMMGEP
ncbi:MAG: twitching motility protein PilT [Thermoplasmata archaeon]|nr:twitching motility protein PilT [Thermoplasmata archaeon]